MAAPRLLTIMGSGETTATMVPVHRAVFERLGGRPLVAVLDTPYGFQENADELTGRTLDYFHTSLPLAEVEVASLRSAGDPAPSRERALDTLRRARVVFAGPGSPSYALRVWAGSPVPGILAEKLTAGGALTFASAASITLGRFSLPVYEIYKVGADPHWLDGLDVLGAAGISAVVVPHWDNTEGGTHDTSRCWMGARRFAALRSRLPAGVTILGVDEHTACLLDLEDGRFTVAGKGTVTLLVGPDSTVLGPGDSAPTSLLSAAPYEPVEPPSHSPPPSLASLRGEFHRAVQANDAGAALSVILTLEDAHQAWDADAAAEAHSSLLGMVTRFATVMAGLRLDDNARAGAVEALLGVRARARADGRWEDADAIRRALGLLSVEVHDTPGGTVWEPLG
ncbi:MAG TPA: hypothetical protein VMX37_05155 [Acidimicrobiia bacterium]|nr:hypothetical protein [Acidimicrobiia bacterium]